MVDASLEILWLSVVRVSVDGFVVGDGDDGDDFLSGVEMLSGADKQHLHNEVEVLPEKGSEDKRINMLNSCQQLEDPYDVFFQLQPDLSTQTTIS